MSDDPERTRLLATYGARGLRRMLTGVYETLAPPAVSSCSRSPSGPASRRGSKSCGGGSVRRR